MSLVLLDEFLARNLRVQFLRLQWQDLSGLLRARIVPVEQARLIAAGEKSVRLSPCSLSLAIDNTLLPSVPLIGGDIGHPDWSSLKTRPSLDPLYASVMCCISRDVAEISGDRCPRKALARIVEKAAAEFGMHILVGFEVEFEVYSRNDTGQMIHLSRGLGGAACSGLRDPSFKIVEEVMLVLLAAGVDLEAIHSEGPQGQYEFCLAPKPPMQAVDELVFVHDTLKTAFARHGLVATMFPRPVAGRRQSIGQHTHISLNNLALQEPFLAGILRRLPALCALCMPYELSYERLTPGQAGVRFVAWGTQDRRVPVRKVRQGHWEVRCVDATANMYAALSATLSAGLLGCVEGEELAMEDSARRKHVISGVALPHSLVEALNKLDDVHDKLDGYIEGCVLEHYIELKRYEASRLEQMAVDDARNYLIEHL